MGAKVHKKDVPPLYQAGHLLEFFNLNGQLDYLRWMVTARSSDAHLGP